MIKNNINENTDEEDDSANELSIIDNDNDETEY